MNYLQLQKHRAPSEGGFTLIELIMVVSIMSLLLAFIAPAVVSLSAGRDIDKAVDIAESTASMARQQAMTKGTMVALVVSGTSTASLTNAQQLLLLQANTSTTGAVTWIPTSQAIRLPADVQATTATSFYSPGSGSIPSFPTTVTSGTQILSDFSYILFFADGSVSAPGSVSGPSINLQKTTKGGVNPDFMVLIQQNSGRTKVNAVQ